MSMPRSGCKSWARERFRGFENVLVPSFSANLRSLDEQGIRLDVRQSMRHGCFSLHCALDAGLTPEEQRCMLGIATDEAGGRIGVSLPLSGTVEESIALVRHAESAGATHAHLGFPQSFRPRAQEEIVELATRIARSTSLGLCLLAGGRCAFPHLHPSGVPFEGFERLADLDNVIGLVIDSMDAGVILECCERFGDRLLVTTPHVGLLPILCASFDVQWSGPWTIEALQSPEKPHAVRFFDLLRDGQPAEAMKLYWSLAPALGAQQRVAASYVYTGAQHWPILKYQQWLSGGNGGMTRQPVMRLFQRDMQLIRGGLRAVGVECPDPDDEFFTGRSAYGEGT